MDLFTNAYRVALFAFLCLSFLESSAQVWMQGFQYRKKITFDKSKIEGVSTSGSAKLDVVNFPVLVVLEDPDLKYDVHAFENKIRNPQGLDISFALSTNPGVSLNFQLEHYDPVIGKLTCWVLIPVLSANSTATPATSIYFYYGSAALHDPMGASARNMWAADYHHVEHLQSQNIGKIGSGKLFNGVSDRLLIGAAEGDAFTLSAWVKINQLGSEQMIASNDSADFGGYRLKVDASGKVVFEGSYSPTMWTIIGNATPLLPGAWYHVCITFMYNGSGTALLYINNLAQGSKSGLNVRMRNPGQVSIGAGKQTNLFFNGMIDEFRIAKVLRDKAWLQNEYINQNNPLSFYVIGTEEINPGLPVSTYTFIGLKNTLWTEPANWNTGTVPAANRNIKIKAGKTLELNSSAKIVVNKLLLEPGTRLSSADHIQLECTGDVTNHGTISLAGLHAAFIFGGSDHQLFMGNGTATAGKLEIIKTLPEALVDLNAPFSVRNSVDLKSGTLNANENLILLASREGSASLLPVLDLSKAGISGLVKVQCFIDGNFPNPSNGRGWRLLSSPVSQAEIGGQRSYTLHSVKDHVFITGKGGAANGFDQSPNNGTTVYLYDQLLSAASLAEKYVPVPTIHKEIPIGTGFYLFSRGSRLATNAYYHQIEHQPFPNPEPYILTYTGKLLLGSLTVPLYNKDIGSEGDGYNLLGNPYASAIRWGSLVKNNVGPFIWLFDPLNNTYKVSNDPEEVIPAGAGFFVKVLGGNTTGSIGFTESAKIQRNE